MVNSVVKKFGNLAAVNDCTLGLEKDGIYGLVGPNGSGKTTLFNLISGFLRPDRGKIVFAEKSIGGKNPISITKMGIARTFQLPRVFANLTVEENLEAAISGQSRKIGELIEIFGLKEVRNAPASTISFGQKKQLELARVLALNPSLLLLDEPTSGLEPSLVKITVDQIKYVRELGKSIFIIEHNMNVIMNLAERIFVLHNGRKIAEGTPNEVKSNTLVIDAYLGESEEAEEGSGVSA
ncbi:MAG TPA: ATP-binding cassette domain-containing protein [Nitrososphaerales archaeon]|nr:ATP-binding cassette domain-containing protein [Nitrososphaerales archaeon]